MFTTLLALQTLTNLSFAPLGPGLPERWQVKQVGRNGAPSFQVTTGHALRIEANAQSGFGRHPLRAPIRPSRGRLMWRWRTGTAIKGASLRVRARADSPVRVFVEYDDGRVLYYSWGNAEPVGDRFAWGGETRSVYVCRRADDANGSWYMESHDPFTDYQRAFNRAPHPIVAVGIGADTDQLGAHTVAEVGEVTWE